MKAKTTQFEKAIADRLFQESVDCSNGQKIDEVLSRVTKEKFFVTPFEFESDKQLVIELKAWPNIVIY